VLYWRAQFETTIEDGIAWHATTWRTIPEYQGGFILDGGVHWAAMLRTVLPKVAEPVAIMAQKSLHRAHILPHDTIVGIVQPAPQATVLAHGEPTALKAVIEAKDMPVQPGTSTPHGTFLFSWAAPSAPRDSAPPNELYIVAEHATLRILATGASWSLTFSPTAASKVDAYTAEGPATGVEVELDDFGHAVGAARAGVADNRVNNAEPTSALWDLAFIEAALSSDGKVVEIQK
jgi:predicted dehydrogenase